MAIAGFTGQFNSTIDEKGRVILPLKIKEKLEEDLLILTRGVDQCLWLFSPGTWEKVATQLLERVSLFDRNFQMVQRRFLAPAHEVALDKTGRIKVSPSLMRSASLTRDCYLLGLVDHLEIWDVAVYEAFEKECLSSIKETWSGLRKIYLEEER